MLRIHFGEDDRWRGKPLGAAIIEEARRQDSGGCDRGPRGLEGYGASSRIHRPHFFQSGDSPIMVAIIDTAEKIDRFLSTLEQMVGEGLIAVSDVEGLIRYTNRADPAPKPD